MTKHTSKAVPKPRYLTDAMLVPKYVTQFKCLGPECSDTCCAGWAITVDKDTFQDYRRVVHPVLKPLLKEYLIQVDKTSYARHGEIGMRKTDSHCGMHSSEGLCQVQQQLGEDALSDTCYIYPRSMVKFGDRFEESLTLSCPEAARLALTQADAFEFVSAEFTTRLSTTTVIGPRCGFSMESMDEVHIFLIQLFQTPALSNTERLAIVGWLCQQLDDLVRTGAQASANALVAEMRAVVETGHIHTIVGQLNGKQEASVTLFSILFGNKSTLGRSALQSTVLEQVREGLGIHSDLDFTKISENYARGTKLLSADGTHDRLMTQYLLNDLIRETFPWKQPTAMKHYQRLLTRYGILRLMLAGVAANMDTTPNEAAIVQTTSVFCRLYQHDSRLASHADELLAQSDWTKLERLYSLLN